ncbi:hypothetical protein Mapa_001459 [Marchantia paleacea]|nr:hypothetical protein Mapa_001459 [Marchantia paleacea]
MVLNCSTVRVEPGFVVIYSGHGLPEARPPTCAGAKKKLSVECEAHRKHLSYASVHSLPSESTPQLRAPYIDRARGPWSDHEDDRWD